MRRRTLLLAASAPALAPARAQVARMGSHGMAVFGGAGGLMASHLPMFHRPHDVQVLLRLRLQDAALDRRLRDILARKPRLWTLIPERFDLDRLDPEHPAPLQAFRGTLHEGHFERGGPARFEVRCRVEAVPLFQRLSGEPRRANRQRFLWFGLGSDQFLVKRLDQRPDIDLIGRFEAVSPWTGQRELELPAPEGLAAPSAQALRVAGVPGPVHWLVAETGDLA